MEVIETEDESIHEVLADDATLTVYFAVNIFVEPHFSLKLQRNSTRLNKNDRENKSKKETDAEGQ